MEAPRPRTALLTLAAGALLVPLLVVAPVSHAAPSATAPAPTPTPSSTRPAAPGTSACTVTQAPMGDGPMTTVSKPRNLKLTRVKDKKRYVVATRTGRTWRVSVRAEVVFSGRATVDVTATYAAADCGLAPRSVTATGSSASRASWTTRRTGVASTKKAATRAAVKKVRAAAKSWARRTIVDRASHRAALNARVNYLATLPHRVPEYTGPKAAVSAAKACPKRLASRASKKAMEARLQPATAVPQFGTPAAIWNCSYDLDGKVAARTKLTGAKKRSALAEVRGLVVQDPRMAIACPLPVAPTRLVSVVGRDGSVTAVHYGGCAGTRLTSNPAKILPGADTTGRVPTGHYL